MGEVPGDEGVQRRREQDGRGDLGADDVERGDGHCFCFLRRGGRRKVDGPEGGVKEAELVKGGGARRGAGVQRRWRSIGLLRPEKVGVVKKGERDFFSTSSLSSLSRLSFRSFPGDPRWRLHTHTHN